MNYTPDQLQRWDAAYTAFSDSCETEAWSRVDEVAKRKELSELDRIDVFTYALRGIWASRQHLLDRQKAKILDA